MAQNVAKVPVKEVNNYSQGKSGGKTKKLPGMTKGKSGKVNPTKSGGIFRPLKSN